MELHGPKAPNNPKCSGGEDVVRLATGEKLFSARAVLQWHCCTGVMGPMSMEVFQSCGHSGVG